MMTRTPTMRLFWLSAFMVTLAQGASAADVRIDQARVTQGSTTTTYIDLKATDSSLTEAEWRAALGASDYKSTSGILAKLSASRLSIGKIQVETRAGDTTSTTIVQAVEFASITKGYAMAGATGAGEMRITTGSERDVTRFDRITLRNIALALPSRPTDGPLPMAIGEAVIDNLRSEDGPTSSSAIRVLRAENLRGAALDDDVMTILGLIAERDFETLTPIEKSAAAKALDETYRAFELGRITAEGVVSRDGDERTTIARMTLEGGAKPNFVLSDIQVQMGSETTRIGEFRFDDFSLEPTIKSVLAALGNPSQRGEPPLADLLPRLGTMSLSDLSVKGSQIGAYGGESALKSFRLQFNNPLGGVPTGMRISFDGLSAALNPDDPSSTELLALGYRRIDASGAIEIDIDKARDVLALREASLHMKDAGTLHITGSIGNISALMDATGGEDATLAAMGLTLKTLGIGLGNEGLFEKVLAKTAAESGKTPDQVKREMASLAKLGLPGLLGTSPQAKAMVDAAGRFISTPQRIVFAFKSKSPEGIGLADIMMIATPDDFFALTEMTIQAGR